MRSQANPFPASRKWRRPGRVRQGKYHGSRSGRPPPGLCDASPDLQRGGQSWLGPWDRFTRGEGADTERVTALTASRTTDHLASIHGGLDVHSPFGGEGFLKDLLVKTGQRQWIAWFGSPKRGQANVEYAFILSLVAIGTVV